MADYYPLLARAVGGLPDSNAETRRAIYERARKALLGQLKAIEPPIAEADIARENSALDEAVARLEAEFAGKAAAETSDAPEPPAPKLQQTEPHKPAAPPPAAAATPDTTKPPAAAEEQPKPFSFGAPKPSAGEKEAERVEAEEARVEADESAEAGEASELAPPRPREAPRPMAPGPAQQPARGNRLWIVGGVVVGVALLVAGIAIKLKGRPEDLARLRPAPTAPAETPKNGKIAERVGEKPSATPAEPAAPNQSQSPAETPAPTPAASQPPVPVAHRAALLIEAPETQEKVKTYIGSVVWRLDNVPGGAGKPLGVAIHADVDIPDAKVRMALDIQKNNDAALDASHTIEIRFTLLPGSAVPGIKQIGAIQMRREDSVNGDPLAGVPVQITDNYFLVGLQRGDMTTRNVDLLKSRGWLDVPIALTNGRIAKFSLEKGVSGDRVFDDALKAWGETK